MLGIYCRTSKSRDEKYTLDNQREGGIECAKKIGLKFLVYTDDGISGTKGEDVRDGLFEMFSDIKKGNITAVYLINQDRIERDPHTWKLFVSLCLNHNIDFYQDGSKFDLDNSTNRMYASIMSIFNAYYAETTSKKVRLANASKAVEGKTHGIKPYGYKRDKENKYEIFEPESKHVVRMFELSLDGKGAYTIANILNSEGVPTKFSGNFKGKLKRRNNYIFDERKYNYFEKSEIKWRGNVISDILKNPIYKGIRIWRRHEDKIEYIDGKEVKTKFIAQEIIANVPSIVSEQLWDKVQLNFKQNKENVGPKEVYRYLLNGLVLCAKCGKEYRGKLRLKGNDNAYKCSGKIYPQANCSNRGFSIPKLETFIIRLLVFDIKNLKLFKRLPNKVSNYKTLASSLTIKQKEVEGYQKEINNLINLVAKMREGGNIDDTTAQLNNLYKLKNNSELSIKEIERKILEEEEGSFEEKLKKGSKTLLKLNDHLNSIANFTEVKKLVQSLIESININYIPENSIYRLEIRLRGKQSPIYVENKKNTDVWTFTDGNGNFEFNDQDLPDWLKGTAMKRKTPNGSIYVSGIKIPKGKYLNFN